jgi:hypothetical protein
LLGTFGDARHRDSAVHPPGLRRGCPTPWGAWKGEAPVIEISGLGIQEQRIPQERLRQEK